MGWVQNYSGFIAARFFLGVTEVSPVPHLNSADMVIDTLLGGTLSWRYLYLYYMVSSERVTDQSGRLLLCSDNGWSLLRVARVRHRFHGRH